MGLSASSSRDTVKSLDDSQRLFACLAEDMKLPLLQIARQVEFAKINPVAADDSLVGTLASSALEMIDGYLLCLRLQQDPELKFAVQPTSVASTLYDARAKLHATASSYNVRLELDIAGKYGPVLAHRQALLAALVGIGQSVISILPNNKNGRASNLYLSAHSGVHSIVAGIYSDDSSLFNSEVLRKGRELYGRARQPLASVSTSASSGIFIADTILKAMSLDLKAGKYRNKSGLAVSLPLSPQLQLL